MYREHLKCVFISCLLGAADPATSSSSSSSSFVNGATSKNLPAVQTVGPMPEDTMENMRWGSVHSMDHTLRLQEHNLILSRYGLVFFAISNGLQNTSPLYLPHTFPVHSLQSYLFTTETYNAITVTMLITILSRHYTIICVKRLLQRWKWWIGHDVRLLTVVSCVRSLTGKPWKRKAIKLTRRINGIDECKQRYCSTSVQSGGKNLNASCLLAKI